MASNKKRPEEDLDKQILLLASNYVASLLAILQRLLDKKNTDNQ